MGKKLEGAIKGAITTAPISIGYSLADNPSGGLMATGVGAAVGIIHAVAKHHVLSPEQFGPHKFSDAEMAKYNKWYEEAGK